jgi:hypothetical protein
MRCTRVPSASKRIVSDCCPTRVPSATAAAMRLDIILAAVMRMTMKALAFMV